MESLAVASSLVLLVLVPLLDTTYGLDLGEDESSELIKRKETAGSLWFGPRLGKRSETFDSQDDLFELLRNGPWALVPLKGDYAHDSVEVDENRAKKLNYYTPRLGREPKDEELTETSRSPPFAPRLGRRRHNLPFQPRLGRILQQ